MQTGSVFTCRVRVLEQSGLAALGFEVVSSNLAVTFELEGMEYEESGLFCAGGPESNGTYTGVSEIEANGGEAEFRVE